MNSEDNKEPVPTYTSRDVYINTIKCLFPASLLSSFLIGALFIPISTLWLCMEGQGHCPIHSFDDVKYELTLIPLWIILAAAGCIITSFPSVFIGGAAWVFLRKIKADNFYTLFLSGCLIATINGVVFYLMLSGGRDPNYFGSSIFTIGGGLTAVIAHRDLKKLDT